MSLIFAFARDYFDVKIKYDYEMTVLCGLPVLAAVPEFNKDTKNDGKSSGSQNTNKKQAEA